jgi:hypothetical protein
MENTEANTEVEKEQVETTENPQNVLFGTISYADDAAFENFIKGMSVNHAVFILMAAANFAQAKGAFNLLESEALSAAIRALKKTGTSDQVTEDSSKSE